MTHTTRLFRRVAAVGATLALAAAAPLVGSVARAAPAATGTVVTTADGPFGPMLVAGSGKYAGYTLYSITSDYGHKYGCTSKVLSLPIGPYQCTGPESDTHADWPALTTSGAPVAGPGTKQSLLGEVKRSGVGEQVTYAGHPLYLFDQFPGLVSGEGWFEPSLPPDHGAWWVLSPKGTFVPWAMTLGVTKVGHRDVLGALMVDGGNTLLFPAYTYSKGTGCTKACAAAWPPVITQGRAGLLAGVASRDVGTVRRAGGARQLTWKGKALYFFGDEGISSKFTVEGNGNGRTADGGTFRLVTA